MLFIVAGRCCNPPGAFPISWEGIFESVVCMEDGPPKPSPAPVLKAMAALGIPHIEGHKLTNVCLLGDTVDDIRAAVSAGIIGVGVLTPCKFLDHAPSSTALHHTTLHYTTLHDTTNLH